MNRGKNWKVLLVIIVFILGFIIFRQDKLSREEELGVALDNELLLHFKDIRDNEVIRCGYEDLTGNGKKDLVVIYKVKERSNGMVVVLDTDEGYRLTEEVPAPIDNQTIEFKDIDEKDPMEFIVSGSKDGRFGYAIFRIEDNQVKDLFGEGMEDCC